MSDTEILPRSRIIRVSFEIALPAAATSEQVDEWVAWECGGGSIANDNPLINHDLTTIDDPDLEDTGYHLHYAVTNLKVAANGGKTYNLQRTRKREPYEGPGEYDLVTTPPTSSEPADEASKPSSASP